MKVLLLTNEYPPHVYGGAGVHVDHLSRELACFMDVEVRCFGDQHLDVGRLSVRGYAVDESAMTLPGHLKPALSAMARNVAVSSAIVDADIVHCHTWYTHLSGILLKQAYGVPLVVTVHSLEPLRPWKREQLQGGYDLTCWVERTALEMADVVITVSREARSDVLRLFDVEPERVHVIHNGVDASVYRLTRSADVLERYGINAEQPYVLFVGRVTRQKGILHLVRAIPEIDPSVQVILCAGAPDTPEIAAEMESAVRKVTALRSGVVWIPEMLPREAAVQLYSHAAVFCCPSIYEPFGIINLEAMACETPVVASAVGGIPEVVIDGETGVLVPLEQERGSLEPVDASRFSHDLAKATNRLLDEPLLRLRMGKAGRERAEREFSWRTVARRTAEVYQTLVQG